MTELNKPDENAEKKEETVKTDGGGCFKKTKQAFLNFVDGNKPISWVLRHLHIRDAREFNRPSRTLFVNNIRPDDLDDKQLTPERLPIKYCSNKIRTSRYRWWNFIVLNLLEQMVRVANVYFIINVLVIFVLPNPPSSPYSYLAPLLFVLILTGLQQGYADVLRHVADRKINKSKVNLLVGEKLEKRPCEKIKVGDVVEVNADEPLPCDILLLSCTGAESHHQPYCYITTANLDGESNLKKKWIPNEFPELKTLEELAKFRAFVECDKPNVNMHEFNGKVTLKGSKIYITNENILLRGCVLKATHKIYGCAIYTGKNTKLMLNTKIKSNKLSTVERRMNIYIGVYLVVLTIISFTAFGASFAYNSFFYSDAWYLSGITPSYYDTDRNLYNFIHLITFYNLFHLLVPLSMYVTIIIQRFVGSRFISWDNEMYDEKSDQRAVVNSTDLNEDLGQVEYLFSDKTGTLTDNQMVFKQFAIDGVSYKELDGKLLQVYSDKIFLPNNEIFKRLFQILTLCHTVQVDRSMSEPYQASSPDEHSFLKFCDSLNIRFESETKSSSQTIRTIRYSDGQEEQYELLEVLEFDSTRRRMSVIVRQIKSNQIMLLTKGAESNVLPICTKSSEAQRLACDTSARKYAEDGWRTLVLAYKELSVVEWTTVQSRLRAAYEKLTSADTSTVRRDDALRPIYESIECDMKVVGVTGIEDKLQEGVAETLEFLRQGGIKVWVLTGDKKETAVNISTSCKHFGQDMIKLDLSETKLVKEIYDKLDVFKDLMTKEPKQKYGLIVDGQTFHNIFDDTKLKKEFTQVCLKCEAVLCCRMSPAQKAQVVRLVKKTKGRPITAAIGDGANDVSMIQEAHVGLGIFGKEGRQAARSADFAYARFRFTKRILFVHGFLFYTRISFMVNYFFYKNFLFSMGQFFHCFITGFSATSLFDSVTLGVFNVVYTSAPILFYGYFEQNVPIKKLETYPYHYKTITRNRHLSVGHFLMWNGIGVWHAFTIYGFSYALFSANTALSADGKMLGASSFKALITTIILIVLHVKLFIEWRHRTMALVVSFLFSFVGFVIFALVFNSFISPRFLYTFTDGQNYYWSYFSILERPVIIFFIWLTTLVAIMPDLCIKAIQNMYIRYMTLRNNGFQPESKKSGVKRTKSHKDSNNIPLQVVDVENEKF